MPNRRHKIDFMLQMRCETKGMIDNHIRDQSLLDLSYYLGVYDGRIIHSKNDEYSKEQHVNSKKLIKLYYDKKYLEYEQSQHI